MQSALKQAQRRLVCEMDVRATLLWRLSQLCSSLKDNHCHGSALPCAYYLPHRKVAWKGQEKIAVSLRADAFCWPEAGGSFGFYLLLAQAWLFTDVAMGTIRHAQLSYVCFLYWVQFSG